MARRAGRHQAMEIERNRNASDGDSIARGSGTISRKQMRLGPATQAALLSRMLLAAVFRPKDEDHHLLALRKAPCGDVRPEARASSLPIQRFNPALGRKGSRRRPQRPGTSSLDM